MKTLYLKDENYNWKLFKYKSLNDLKKEFSSINITIGDGCNFGYCCNLGNEIKLITGFYINGSQHIVTYVGNGKISIGCHTKKNILV